MFILFFFFFFGRIRRRPQKLVYYGVIDHVEWIDASENSNQKRTLEVVLNCLDADTVNGMFRNNPSASIFDNIGLFRPVYVKVSVTLEFDFDVWRYRSALGNEGRWVQVFTTQDIDNGITIQQWPASEQTEKPNYTFKLLTRRNARNRTLLDNFEKSFDLAQSCKEYVNEEKAIEILKNIAPKGELNALCYNVGQGNAICINESKDGTTKPLMYFDIGGGATFNTFTYPVARQFSTHDDTVIVLSHWDEDHYETARREIGLVQGCAVIAPAQHVNPSNLLFLKQVIEHGRLVLLPRGFGTIDFPLGSLISCQGNANSKNNSGIAMELKLGKKDDINTVLMPGDAQYRYIFRNNENHYDAIVASHHGGLLIHSVRPRRNFPMPNHTSGFIAYSYGANNTHSHVLDSARDKHIARQWGEDNGNGDVTRLDTVNGDITFTFLRQKKQSCATNDGTPMNNFYNHQEHIASQLGGLLGSDNITI